MATGDTIADFDSFVEEAGKWTTKSDILVEILKWDKKEKQIYFCIPDKNHICFYVAVQKKDTSGSNQSLHLWSENAEVLECLGPAIEDSLSTNKSITSILDKANKCLKKFLESSRKSDEKDKESDKDSFYKDCEDGDDDNDDDDDADDDGYYNNDDEEVMEPVEDKKKHSDEDDDDEQLFKASGNPAAIDRLTKDLKLMKKISGMYGFRGAPRENNLFIWDVTLIDIPETTLLGEDIKKYAKKYNVEPVIFLEMHFPTLYPFDPPFIRIVKPRFKFLTGHVTIGGSICMQLLTKSGWLPTYDIEQVLVQVRSVILSDERAQLDSYNPNNSYNMHEAQTAFNRMVHRYGW